MVVPTNTTRIKSTPASETNFPIRIIGSKTNDIPFPFQIRQLQNRFSSLVLASPPSTGFSDFELEFLLVVWLIPVFLE